MAATYSSLVGLAVGGKYEVRRVLGIGGMGVVCEAVHLDLGKKVAIKLIDKSMKESELIVARFRREARALGQIQSEHIVDVFDVGADARVGLYMVMEHLPGEDLQTRLERDKRLDVTTAMMVAHQMARALEKAHAAGVIHRDLKPANVFLTFRDNGSMLVKLLDFGVSKLLNDVGGARITGSGAPIGTPLYMSPEQAEGKDDTDGRADIWSLGAVLYEALAGTPPFADRGSYHGTIVGILTSRPTLLHDAAPWVPIEIAKVIDAMLVHDRAARIKDAAAVTKRLLDAFPAVLPDGTGRHTAVIVPTTQVVDATGDTEIFTSAAFKEAQQRGSRPSAADRPSTEGRRDSDSRTSGGFPDDEDSKRTVPNVSSAPGIGILGASSEATRTAAATPVEMARGAAISSPPNSPPAGSVSGAGGGGPRTDPLPWLSAASSSASGVAMPGTPPLIEPLPGPHDIAPDTQRDTALAVRAERRRWMMLGMIAAVIASVAVGGYLAGRRSTPPSVATPTATPSAPTEATAGATPAATATAIALAPAASEALTAASATAPGPTASASATDAAAQASAAPSAAPDAPPPRRRPRAKGSPVTPHTTASASASAHDSKAPGTSGIAVPENPFAEPKPEPAPPAAE